MSLHKTKQKCQNLPGGRGALPQHQNLRKLMLLYSALFSSKNILMPLLYFELIFFISLNFSDLEIRISVTAPRRTELRYGLTIFTCFKNELCFLFCFNLHLKNLYSFKFPCRTYIKKL